MWDSTSQESQSSVNMLSDRRQRRRIPFQRPIRVTTPQGDKVSLM